MRVAALYDVHGNLPALEAVLEDVDEGGRRRDRRRRGRALGPVPGRVRRPGSERQARPSLRGNCERDVLRPESDTDRWCAARLDDETRALVAGWPLTVARELAGLGAVVFCHATPSDDEGIVTG